MQGKWKRNGNKIEPTIDVKFERWFLVNIALPAVRAWFFGFRGSKLGANIDPEINQNLSGFWIVFGKVSGAMLDLKIDQKSIKNRIDFFIDF